MNLTATPRSMFKTPEGQARYFAAYDATLALWPVPVTPLSVPTRFGDTHVNACGPEGAPPLVLLHGAAISSTMWYPNVAALSRAYRVYAPDIIGEMGKSVRTHPLAQPADFTAWLSELFDGLRLDQAHVAGVSLGGYLALQLAHSVPERVMKLVLLRHGESTWNRENRFTGWTDVDLSDKGLLEARESGQILHQQGYVFDVAFSPSPL